MPDDIGMPPMPDEEDATLGMFMPDIDDDIPALAGAVDMEWVEFELPHAESSATPAAVTPMSA